MRKKRFLMTVFLSIVAFKGFSFFRAGGIDFKESNLIESVEKQHEKRENFEKLQEKVEPGDVEENVQLSDKQKRIHYKPSIESLRSRPLPQWFDDAKIGIFIHWGVYSVPAIGGENFASEWFWYRWAVDKHPVLKDFMNKTRPPGFTYPSFARELTAEYFDPIEWVKLFEEAGAKYVVLTTKHHDGYTLWPSKYSFSWNSVDVGPHRDLVGGLAEAVSNNSTLKLGLYYSLLEWFDRHFLHDRKRKFHSQSYPKLKMIPQIKELVRTYKPELLWSDGHWDAPSQYWGSKNLLAWLYNESPKRDTIVTNDRWGKDVRRKLGDYATGPDRFNPGTMQTLKFENCMTLDRYSWGYRENAKLEDYLTMEGVIREVVTTVSCNGNILINVGPTKSGVIKPIFVERLRDLGRWLKINGEAVYGSRPWIHVKENNNIWFTKKTDEDRTNLYAFVLEYPFDKNTIALSKVAEFIDSKTTIKLLGFDGNIKFQKAAGSLQIWFPDKREIDKRGLKYAWTFKIDIPSRK